MPFGSGHVTATRLWQHCQRERLASRARTSPSWREETKSLEERTELFNAWGYLGTRAWLVFVIKMVSCMFFIPLFNKEAE